MKIKISVEIKGRTQIVGYQNNIHLEFVYFHTTPISNLEETKRTYYNSKTLATFMKRMLTRYDTFGWNIV
jgi:hypothetical protein